MLTYKSKWLLIQVTWMVFFTLRLPVRDSTWMSAMLLHSVKCLLALMQVTTSDLTKWQVIMEFRHECAVFMMWALYLHTQYRFFTWQLWYGKWPRSLKRLLDLELTFPWNNLWKLSCHIWIWSKYPIHDCMILTRSPLLCHRIYFQSDQDYYYPWQTLLDSLLNCTHWLLDIIQPVRKWAKIHVVDFDACHMAE